MSVAQANSADTGLEVIDLREDTDFAARRLHPRNATIQLEGMQRLARAFVESPETILQELVNAAVDLCGADSSGISMEREVRTEDNFYHWVATAGEYAGFLHATLPQHPSACGVCLERGGPQLFRVTQRFFDIMGIEAPVVTDGILLPWEVDGTRGTIWIMAHGRDEAFDPEDLRMMQMLADFASMSVRHQRQHETLMKQAKAAAAADMAHDLAHQINNPLQSLTNILYLAEAGQMGGDAKELAAELSEHLQRLSVLAGRLLSLPAALRKSIAPGSRLTQ